MKNYINSNFTLENYLDQLILFSSVCTATVFGLMIKVAFFIDLSIMNV